MYDTQRVDDALKKLAFKHFQDNTLVDGNTLIHKKTGEVLDPEVDYTTWKYKF